MTDTLDEEARLAIIAYRIEKSASALKEAEILSENQFFDSAVTRLYYACFYMASALLISKNIECGTHAGVKRMFALHFVRTGIIAQTHLSTFSNLMQGRQLSDYEDFSYQDSDSYAVYRQQAEAFIAAIRPLIDLNDKQ